MSQVQTIRSGGSGFNPFSIATIVMMLLYVMPQSVVFIHNDLMAIIATVYYVVFAGKYVDSGKVIKAILVAVPYLIIFWLNNFPGSFKLGFVLPLMTLWTLIMPCFAMVAIVNRNNFPEQKVILIATGLCLLYITVVSFMALSINPVIMRYEGGDETLIHQARMMGVGGYGTAYAMGALFIALWAIKKYIKKSFISPVVYYVMIITCGLLVVRAQYATLLFLTIFGVGLHYIFEANSFRKRVLVIITSIIIFVLAQPLIQFGMSFFGGQLLGFKFQLVFDSLWGGGGVETISGERSEYQLDAFGLFLQSPLFGVSNVINIEEYNNAHSEIIGVMAATGIVGIISYMSSFIVAVKYAINNCFISKVDKILYYPVIAFYLAFAFLNPISYAFECPWVIFLIIPLLFVAVRNSIRK